jgi:hypothetical protein
LLANLDKPKREQVKFLANLMFGFGLSKLGFNFLNISFLFIFVDDETKNHCHEKINFHIHNGPSPDTVVRLFPEKRFIFQQQGFLNAL